VTKPEKVALINVQKTTVLAFPELVARIKKKHQSIATNPRYQRNGLKAGLSYLDKLEDLRRRNIINVDLEVPKEFVRELRCNKVFRKGGILRKTNSREIAKHLKEVKPSNVRKLVKAANFAFVAIDVLESALLDEKLKAILEIVKSVEAKLDAQNRGKLKGALAAMQEIALIQDPETKRQRINLIQNSLKESEWILREEYENRWSKYSSSMVSFDSSKITNTSELTQMRDQAKALVEDLESIVLCQVGHTQLYVILNEYVAAEKGAEELTAFVADNLERFKNAFGAPSLDTKESKHKTIFNLGKQQKFADFRERVFEPNERIEHLLNQTIIYSLTVPEEIVSSADLDEEEPLSLHGESSMTIWDRLAMLWLRLVYRLKNFWRSLFSRDSSLQSSL
jgi:hypothetical protein